MFNQILGSTKSPDLSNLTVYDFTASPVTTHAHIDNVLPLARGGDYLTEFDLICAPVMDGREVEYFVIGRLYGWNDTTACILDNHGYFHYTPVTALEECALLIAPVVVDESIVREYEKWVQYVASLEEQVAA